MSCNPNPCSNGGTCVADNSTSNGYICACPERFTGDDCATLSGGSLSVQVIAAIVACCVTVLLICLIFTIAVVYSLWRKYSDRNAIHVRRRPNRSVYDKASQKYGREYIDAQYNPDRFGTDMYENKAAMIAKRWDSKEDIDSGFLGDRSTTAGNGASAKHKSPDKDNSLDLATFERSQKMRSTPKDADLVENPTGSELPNWTPGDELDDEDINLSHFTPKKTASIKTGSTLGSSMLQGDADLY